MPESPKTDGSEDNQTVIPQYNVTPTIDVDYAMLKIPVPATKWSTASRSYGTTNP